GKTPFDIVFLDLFLPDSYGQETFKLVQESLQIAPPIVVLSGLSDKNIAMDIVKQGAQDYLVKGEFDANLLEKSILYSIERKKYQDILRRSEKKYRSTFESVAIGIGEYDYSLMFNKVQELKAQGVEHPAVKPVVTKDNVDEWRKLLIGISMNPEGLRLFGFKNYEEYKEKALGIIILKKPKYFNSMAIAVWDQESTVEIQVDYDLPHGRLESLKRLRFLGDGFGFQRMLISTVDVTELKTKEREVQQQSTVLNLIAECSMILLKEESFTNCKDDLLELIGTTLNTSVSALFQCNHEKGSLIKRAEWSSSNKNHYQERFDFSPEFRMEFGGGLNKGNVAKITKEMAQDNPEYELFMTSGDATVYVVPIKRIDLLEGVLVVSRTNHIRDFSGFEI
ncbi:MAG: response regulator, partial [Flavobacteriales bacterium]